MFYGDVTIYIFVNRSSCWGRGEIAHLYVPATFEVIYLILQTVNVTVT